MSYNDVIYSIYRKERYGIITAGCDTISVEDMILQEMKRDYKCEGTATVIPAENMSKTTLQTPASPAC